MRSSACKIFWTMMWPGRVGVASSVLLDSAGIPHMSEKMVHKSPTKKENVPTDTWCPQCTAKSLSLLRGRELRQRLELIEHARTIGSKSQQSQRCSKAIGIKR